MKTKNYIYGLAIATATLALGSCNSEVDLPSVHESTLELEVSDSSRAPVYGNELPDGSVFSMTCVNLTDPTKYEYREVLYSDGQAQIQGEPVILRNDSIYQVSALYPLPPEADMLEDGRLRISSSGKRDYMVAKSNELRYDTSRANLVFNHILSLMRLNIIKDDIVASEYKLDQIKLSSIRVMGWYNLKEQVFSDYVIGGLNITILGGQPLKTDKYYTHDILTIPSDSRKITITLFLSNDKEISTTFECKPLIAGQILNITLTVSADELKVTEQEIRPWKTVEEVDINKATAAAGKAVDLGVSKLWADRNVGAYSATEYGLYYPYNQSVTDLWGEDWQMPTAEDFEELLKNCTWKWVKKGSINGYEVSGNGSSIFLPAAGWFNEGNGYSYDLNFSGLYMSSEQHSALKFSSEGSNVETSVEVDLLRSIRPVKVKK